MGKLSQAVVIAAAAYRDEATFRERTGITNSRLVVDKKNKDCHVSSRDVSLHIAQQHEVCCALRNIDSSLLHRGSAASMSMLRTKDSSMLYCGP